MANAWSAQGGWSGKAGDRLQLSILLNCRTVVESDHRVSTGLMTQVEGEWFEVEISEYDQFQLGEKVKLTVYSPAGIQTFHSSVFAKYEGAIAVIQPPEVKKRYEEKRSQPRVAVNGTMQIIGGLDQAGQTTMFSKPLDVALRNISTSGIGFTAPDLPIFQRNARLKALLTVGISFSCELEVVRQEPRVDGVEIGASMTLDEPETMRSLRALILQLQVENKVQMRQGKK